MVATKSLLIAGILGSIAAACECETDGNISVKPDQIIKKIHSIQNLSSYKSSND